MTEQRKEGRREENRKERKEGKTYDSRITSEGRKEEKKAKMNERYVKDDVRFPVKEEKETSEIGKKEKKKR